MFATIEECHAMYVDRVVNAQLQTCPSVGEAAFNGGVTGGMGVALGISVQESFLIQKRAKAFAKSKRKTYTVYEMLQGLHPMYP